MSQRVFLDNGVMKVDAETYVLLQEMPLKHLPPEIANATAVRVEIATEAELVELEARFKAEGRNR